MKIHDSSVVQACKDQVSRNMDGEIVLLNLATGQYFGLKGVGTRIWELLQQPAQVRQIRDRILAEYNVAEDQCTTDLVTLLHQLAEHGIIKVQEAAG